MNGPIILATAAMMLAAPAIQDAGARHADRDRAARGAPESADLPQYSEATMAAMDRLVADVLRDDAPAPARKPDMVIPDCECGIYLPEMPDQAVLAVLPPQVAAVAARHKKQIEQGRKTK